MEPSYFKSPLYRYYTPFTYKYQDDPPLLIRMHTNKLFLVFLSENHPIKNENVLEVKFIHNTDGLSGKRKRNAPLLQPATRLAVVRTENFTYVIRAGVEGKLIELNELLLTNPNLLKEPEGYLAIMMPPLQKISSIVKRLTEDK
ncbi:unnamed protein product [Blepharisma stoltei]|uniref:Protein Abitram n=1 Tax=Blepharisma stoltei TaxID=1481888 RepID=A0AAU9KKN7_9CILI|nr:unnamed protein product [Blepharisma stoltei]